MPVFVPLIVLFVAVCWALLLAWVQPSGGPLIWITGFGAAVLLPLFPMFLLGQV